MYIRKYIVIIIYNFVYFDKNEMNHNNNLIELLMIVKNSGDILRDCLIHNKQFIDYYTILDTGSSDNTKNIIKEELKDIKGILLEDSTFTNFKDARNKVLKHASRTCKYLIFLDDSYCINGGKELRELLIKQNSPCLSISIGNLYGNTLQNDYLSNRIFNSSSNLTYKFRVHEYINVKPEDIFQITNKKIFINDIETNSHKNRSVMRYKKDIIWLMEDLKDYPQHPRILYYIAKTYYNLEQYTEACEYFNQLKNIHPNDPEYQFASEYELACLTFLLNDDIKQFEKSLLHIENRFNRIESFYKLAVIYKDSGDIALADKYLTIIIHCQKPHLANTLLEHEIYDFLIPYLFIETKIQLNQISIAVPVLKKMLQIYPSNQPLLNIKYAIAENMNISSIRLSSGKTIVFHTGGEEMLVKCWDPIGDNRISGSEYMAINLAQEFRKCGYKVFIIGSFEDNKNNYQCTHEGIEYIDYKYFSDFALMYIIDILIVSRYTSNLIYYDNIKSVYLWIHDLLPMLNQAKCFQIHREKFKHIIAVSQWQKDNVIKHLNIPEHVIAVSRNAIIPERFQPVEVVEKIPYRFIYSSDPTRGLDILINIFPKIIDLIPQCSLVIFTNMSLVETETMNKIQNMKEHVKIYQRISQNDLAIEFLKSDIWFYPTHFKETYCITVLEAMISRCLVVTVNLAGLGEIVTGKGITCSSPVQDKIDDLINKMCFVLDKPAIKERYLNIAEKWAKEQTFSSLCNEWIELFSG